MGNYSTKPPLLIFKPEVTPHKTLENMALKKADLIKLAGQKTNNLSLTDFTFDAEKGYYLHDEGYKLNKLTFVGLDLLESNGIEYTLIAPKEGQEWARAWF